MNRQAPTPTLTALFLALTAGTATHAWAQDSETTTRNAASLRQESASKRPTVEFRSSEWLSSRDVLNTNGDKIANVSDLILDRGTGSVEYLVIKTTTTSGSNRRSVAIPFRSFERMTGKDYFVLGSSAAELQQSPEFTGQAWKDLMESAVDNDGSNDARNTSNVGTNENQLNASHARTNDGRAQADRRDPKSKLSNDTAQQGDPYASNLGSATKTRVEGEVTSVDRVRTGAYGEQVVLTVKAADGTTKKIALGPSWYVNGSEAAPVRGDRITADTLAIPNDADQMLAGTNVRNGDRDLNLRGSDGKAAWIKNSGATTDKSYTTPPSRYILASALRGMKADCRGNEVGKVNELILEQSSGEAAFISVDPNKNFIGINESKIMVPWSVTTAMLDGHIRIDASKDMILASAQTPADLSSLNSAAVYDRVYKPYGVASRRFDSNRIASGTRDEANSAWSASGAVIGSIDRDSAKRIEGQVIDFTDVSFEGDVQAARAVKIRCTGDSSDEELVLLGPAGYMQSQNSTFKAGDTVKVDAVRTTIDGREYWIAKSILCKDQRTVLIDGDNTPAWNNP